MWGKFRYRKAASRTPLPADPPTYWGVAAARPSYARAWMSTAIVLLAAAIAASALTLYQVNYRHHGQNGKPVVKVVWVPFWTADVERVFASGATNCAGGGEIDTSTIRRLSNNAAQTCAFLNNLASGVTAKVKREPNMTSYTLNVYSAAAKKSFSFTCTRRNHMSVCTAPGKDNKLVGGYIKDTARTPANANNADR